MEVALVYDIKGQMFGRLLVLERVDVRAHDVHWLCQCECGKQTIGQSWAIRKGKKVSCGCHKDEQLATGRQKAARNEIRRKRLVVAKRLVCGKAAQIVAESLRCGDFDGIASDELVKAVVNELVVELRRRGQQRNTRW